MFYTNTLGLVLAKILLFAKECNMRTRLARAGEDPDRKRCRGVARRIESIFELDSRRRREEKGERFELDSRRRRVPDCVRLIELGATGSTRGESRGEVEVKSRIGRDRMS